jgi:sugar/nucleoside kinase (ribokinase family)
VSDSTELLAVGTFSLDTVEAGGEVARDVLGGSAPYFGAAARLFAGVELVGVVGVDFPEEAMNRLRSAGIGTAGVRRESGDSFRWHVRYTDGERRTTVATNRATALRGRPEVPAELRDPELLFLGSTDPSIQRAVLDAAGRPRVVVLDTMEHWIHDRRPELEALLPGVDVLLLSEGEAVALGREDEPLLAAERILDLGCAWVVVKRGARGAVAVGPETRVTVSAATARRVVDPTGAGDAFAGGLAGALIDAALPDALATASAVGSFAIESFSVDRLLTLTRDEVGKRRREVERSVDALLSGPPV